MSKSYRYQARAMRVDLDEQARRKVERLVRIYRAMPGQVGTVTAQSIMPEVVRRGLNAMLEEAQEDDQKVG